MDPAWEFAVAPPGLAPGVDSVVGYRAYAPPPLHRGRPSSRLTFIVSLDEGVRVADDPAGLPAAAPLPVLLGGLHQRATYVGQGAGQAGVQLAVHPLAARALFGVPAGELLQAGYDGTPLLGRTARSLPERLAEAPGWAAAFGVVADLLAGRASDARGRLRPDLSRAWHLLEASRGQARIDRVAADVGLSTRHLGALFRRELGRSPKEVAGLMRFEHAMARIEAGVRHHGRPDLARTAAVAGYADQAHLTRDVTHRLGLSPTAWVAAELRNVQDRPVDDLRPWSHDDEPLPLPDPARR